MSDARIETCFICDQPTGHAGQSDDSIYWVGIGPWCDECSAALRAEVESDTDCSAATRAAFERAAEWCDKQAWSEATVAVEVKSHGQYHAAAQMRRQARIHQDSAAHFRALAGGRDE